MVWGRRECYHLLLKKKKINPQMGRPRLGSTGLIVLESGEDRKWPCHLSIADTSRAIKQEGKKPFEGVSPVS